MSHRIQIPLRLVGFIVCFAVIFMYFYVPAPDGMNDEDKWLLRKLFAVSQLAKVVARLGAAVGYDSVININRSLKNSGIVSLTKPDLFKEVISRDYIFDGVNVTVHQKPRKPKGLQPALFFVHGGGWVYEYRELYANFERYLAEKLHHTVVTVDYPLAPENPYPIPFEACLKALHYLHKNAEEFDIDPQRISVGGDSAGGNIAAALALKVRDEGSSFIHRVVLISPAIQFATFRLESFSENDKDSLLSKKSIIGYWLHYIGESAEYANELASNEHLSEKIVKSSVWPYLQKYQSFPQSHVKIDEKVINRWEKKLLDPYLCPMLATSLKGLPETIILVCEYDTLRDEAMAYADRLRDEGVKVMVKKWPGFHGIYTFFEESKTGRAMADSIVEFMKLSDSEKSQIPQGA